ncbi:MAG: hypothetical protein ACJAT2_000750 [Bacteriovoracaceae bacterium]|jgi:hypothetical protein
MQDSKIYNKVLELHNRYEDWVSPLFFLFGFLFDVLTLGRIDDPLNIISQGIYLIILYSFLYFEFTGTPEHKKLEKVFKFKDEIFHFLLGALLSAFTLFYFKSASLSASFVFMLTIFILLVINELQVFQKLGLLIKSTLLFLCLVTYFLYIIPLIIGKVGFFPFIFSLIVPIAILFLFASFLRKKGSDQKRIEKGMIYPSMGLIALFIIFYVFKLIPPIPLSAQHLGIYHNIEKAYPKYKLSHEKPRWKFWETGDQLFRAMPEDKIFVFTRIFAPGGFEDKIVLHFLKETNDGYKTSDKIPLTITGGRGEGFRGFAYKSNYTPGNWRVQVETKDELEIARINFEVVETPSAPRLLKEEIH